MEDTNSVKNQTATPDRNSLGSLDQLIFNDNSNNKLISKQSIGRLQTSIENAKEDSERKNKTPEFSPPQSPIGKPSVRGPPGTTTASTVIWYVCICILFVVAFLALVLSVLYFINDTSSEQVIKLYGITGAGTLAIVTFVIVFLDCCNDGSREDHEEETIYRILQVKESKENAIDVPHKRRIAEGKQEKPKPFIIQHQRPPQISSDPHPHPYHHHYPHYHPHPVQHNHVHPPTSYHHPFVCPICHDLHAPRPNFTDIAIDTSDKFEPVSKNKKVVHKSTRDAQTHPRAWDAERGTQTDRAAGTQTSTMELSGIPSNITEIIHETTILKAPRSLLATLKKSMVQQDKDIAINRAVSDSNIMITPIV